MFLMIDPEKCTGCRTCESFCSFRWEKAVAPTRSAITVTKWEEDGASFPVVCQQCARPACAEVCVAYGVKRDEATGGLEVDTARCVGCKMCVTACALGGMAYIPELGVCRKCDLCRGEPLCAQVCPHEAIEVVTDDLPVSRKRRAVAERFHNYLKSTAEGE